MTSAEIQSHEARKHYCFYVDTPEEANAWISVLMRCTLPFQFLSRCFAGVPCRGVRVQRESGAHPRRQRASQGEG